MTAHERAEALCIQAEKLGLCHPTESMTAEALDNALCDQRDEIIHTLETEGQRKAAKHLENKLRLERLNQQEQ